MKVFRKFKDFVKESAVGHIEDLSDFISQGEDTREMVGIGLEILSGAGAIVSMGVGIIMNLAGAEKSAIMNDLFAMLGLVGATGILELDGRISQNFTFRQANRDYSILKLFSALGYEAYKVVSLPFRKIAELVEYIKDKKEERNKEEELIEESEME